jgi:hypothetical protein
MDDQIEAVQTPKILLTWRADLQGTTVELDGIRNLDLALGMLEMAKANLQFQRNMIAANQMEAQQAEIRKAKQRLSQQIDRNGGLIR